VVLHTDFESAARRFPATLAELAPSADGVLLRLRAESLDWAAGLLASAGCSFTVVRPDELRAHLAALAARLTAA
jgi:predicted DNA-binding transcriptional regulator YafY